MCDVWLEYMAFLGHMASGNGIGVDTQKVEVVQSCPRPTSPTEKRIFLVWLATIEDLLRDFNLFYLL